MQDFLTTNQTVSPPISPLWFTIMVLVLAILTWLTVKYRDQKWYNYLFKWLQIVQLLSLYIWYFSYQIPWSDSLPLYHCRLAMLALILLPDKWPFKQYFALLGVSGAVFALGYPVLDPYDFPHITAFSFIVGHYVLFVNGLSYLLRQYEKQLLSVKRIISYTLLMNVLLVLANQITGGNYGLLRTPPFISQHHLIVKYLAVSFILSLALLLFDIYFKRRELTLPKQLRR